MYCVTWFWGIRRQRLLGITHRHRNTRKVTTCWKTNKGVLYIHVRLKYKIYFYFKTINCVTYRMSCKKSVPTVEMFKNINTFVFIPSSWTSQWHINLQQNTKFIWIAYLFANVSSYIAKSLPFSKMYALGQPYCKN